MVLRFLPLLLAALILAGCGLSPGKTVTQKAEPVVCVVLIDGTKSYRFLDKAKATALKVLDGLPGGSVAYVRWITEDSTGDGASMVSIAFPDAVKPKNAFDVKAKQHFRAQVAGSEQVRKQVREIVSRAPSPRAAMTDIYGALYAASTRIAGKPSFRPMVVLMTDMDDNMKKSYPVDLRGAAVKILDYQVGNASDDARKTSWQRYLAEHGASGVEFLHIDDPLTGGV